MWHINNYRTFLKHFWAFSAHRNAQVGAQMSAQVGAQVGAQMSAQVGAQVGAQMSAQVSPHIFSLLVRVFYSSLK